MGYSARFISRRIAAYTCCYGAAAHARMMHRSTGDEAAAQEAWQQMLVLDWALRVLRAYEPADAEGFECCTQWVSTDEQVCCAVKLADPCCVRAGCAPTPRPTCDIVPNYTVLGAIASADLPGSGEEGDSYYIVSGTPAGNIYTWNGASWDLSAVPLNQVVFDEATGLFWTNIGNGPGLLFPVPLLTQVSGSLYSVAQATVNTASNRAVRLQVLGVNGWMTVSPEWSESDLPQQVNLEGIAFLQVRFLYRLSNGCEHTSDGAVTVPPLGPCEFQSDYTAARVIDANEQGLLMDGTYFIATDQYSVGNTYSAHVGELVQVPGDAFTALAPGETVYDAQNEVFWQQTSAGPSPLFIPVTIEQTLSSYELTSDYPAQSAVGNRFVGVEVLTSAGWVIFWAGFEYDLPQTLPLFLSFTEVRVTYVYPGECAYTVPGAFVPLGNVDEPVTCGELTFGQYLMSDPDQTLATTFLYTGDLGFETLTMTFISGYLPENVCLIFYDDVGGNQFGQICGPYDFNGVATAFQSPTNKIYMVFTVTEPVDFPPTPLWWQVGCTPGAPPLVASVTPVDDCPAWEFSLDVNVSDTGGASTLSIGYSVDGGTEQVEPNVGLGITTIGPFPYESEVIVRLISDEPNPGANITLGIFTNDGECGNSSNPCAPDVGYKVNQIGDLSLLPADPGLPAYGFFVSSDTTGIGTWPVGSLLGWDDINEEWFDVSYTPGIIISDGITFWLAGGLGFQPYNVFPVPELTPTGTTPLNWTIYAPDVQNYNMTINTPFTLQVRNGMNPWSDAYTGTLQQLITPLGINIYQPFTQARVVWYYEDDCGFIGGVQIIIE